MFRNYCVILRQLVAINLTLGTLLQTGDDVNILGGSVHTVREKAESLVVATKEIGLEQACQTEGPPRAIWVTFVLS
jgi:hypothetical protein